MSLIIDKMTAVKLSHQTANQCIITFICRGYKQQEGLAVHFEINTMDLTRIKMRVTLHILNNTEGTISRFTLSERLFEAMELRRNKRSS